MSTDTKETNDDGELTSKKPLVDSGPIPAPGMAQPYTLLEKCRVSRDSYKLRFDISHRFRLGLDDSSPTCLSVHMAADTAASQEKIAKKGKPVKKSYSPISHPSTRGHFDLLVKAYPPEEGRPGLGAYICQTEVGASITASLKSPRLIHGSSSVLGRGWESVGIIAGGTGIAPLYQLLQIWLNAETWTEAPKRIYIWSINRHQDGILLQEDMNVLAKEHSDRLVSVTYSLTGSESVDTCEHTVSEPNIHYARGRGTIELVKSAMPPPSDSTMIFVCGTDGFVDYWGGSVQRGPPEPGKTKGPKIQGPLMGLLKEVGYTESMVYKY